MEPKAMHIARSRKLFFWKNAGEQKRVFKISNNFTGWNSSELEEKKQTW